MCKNVIFKKLSFAEKRVKRWNFNRKLNCYIFFTIFAFSPSKIGTFKRSTGCFFNNGFYDLAV